MKPENRVTEYLSEVPANVPAGHVVVHDRVKSARRLGRLGVHGFRAWLEPVGTADREPCPCPWAPELGGHSRLILTVSTGGEDIPLQAGTRRRQTDRRGTTPLSDSAAAG